MYVFEFKDYKPFLNRLIVQSPKKGRGLSRRLAEHLHVSPVLISQVLSGSRDFTPEQSLLIAEFFGLNESATEYFHLLVQKARAGNHQLKTYLEKKLDKMRTQDALRNRVVEHKELTEESKGIFYSNWIYAAVSLLSSIEGFNSADEMARYFRLTRAQIAPILSFLLSTGLCTEEKGRIKLGATATYVGTESPFVNSHRRNWRLKAMERFTSATASDLFYSSPCSLSKADADLIRKELAKMIGEISKRVSDSPPEKLACLNIDWFEF